MTDPADKTDPPPTTAVDPALQQLVEEIFERARARPHADRDALIDGATDDAWVRSEVRSLLKFDSSTIATRDDGHGAPFDADACIGVSTGGFTLRRVIGSGGMGTVFEADQELPARRIAMKVLHGPASRASALARFRKESEFLARLDHPNIARVIAAGSLQVPGDGGTRPYFAMELVAGGRSITRWARESRASRRELVERMAIACDAVGSGHHLGIVHLDLKPGNLLISETGAVRVIDYGIARSLDTGGDGEQAGAPFAGTPQYMGPEQFVRGERIDSRADVYALGLILYELVTGRLPYETRGEPLPVVARIVRETEPVAPRRIDSTIPRELEAIILKAIAKRPDDRYGTASELGDELGRWIRDEPVLALPPTIAATVLRGVRRNPLPSVLAVVALLSIAFGVVAMVVYGVQASAAAESARLTAARAKLRAAGTALALGYAAEATREVDSVPMNLRGWETRHLEARLSNLELYGIAPSEILSVCELPATGEVVAGITGVRIGVADLHGRHGMELYDLSPYLASTATTVYSVDATDDGRIIAGAIPDGSTVVIDREARSIRVVRRGGRHLRIVGRTLILGDYGGGLAFIDIDSLEVRGEFRGSAPAIDFSFSRDGTVALVLCGDGSLRCLDIEPAQARARERWATPPRVGSGRAAAVSPDGTTMIALWWDGRIARLDPRTGGIVREVDFPGGGAFDIAISPNNDIAAASSWSAEVRVFDVDSLEIRRRFGGTVTHIWGIAFSTDGSRLFGRMVRPRISERSPPDALVDWVGGWVVSGHTAIRDLELGFQLTAARAAEPGRFVASDGDGNLLLIDIRTGVHRVVAQLGAPARFLAWSPQTVAAGLADGSVVLVPIRGEGADQSFGAARRIPSVFASPIAGLDFSPDGTRLACGARGTEVAMVDVSEGAVIWRSTLSGGAGDPQRRQFNRALFLDGGTRVTFFGQIAAESRQDFETATGRNITPEGRKLAQESLDAFLHPVTGRMYASGVTGEVYEHDERNATRVFGVSQSGGIVCTDVRGERAFIAARDSILRIAAFDPFEILMQLDAPAGQPLALDFDDETDELTVVTSRGTARTWAGRAVRVEEPGFVMPPSIELDGERLNPTP